MHETPSSARINPHTSLAPRPLASPLPYGSLHTDGHTPNGPYVPYAALFAPFAWNIGPFAVQFHICAKMGLSVSLAGLCASHALYAQ